MKDFIADHADIVVNFEKEGRHGLAKFARHQILRKRGSYSISQEALEFFDKLATAFLDAAASGKSRDIRAVVQDPELGLVHSRKGQPRQVIGPHTNVELHDAFWVALYRAELVESGVPAIEADERTREKFEYEDARSVRRATKLYKKQVQEKMEIRALARAALGQLE